MVRQTYETVAMLMNTKNKLTESQEIPTRGAIYYADWLNMSKNRAQYTP
jgi:hypothetical protein